MPRDQNFVGFCKMSFVFARGFEGFSVLNIKGNIGISKFHKFSGYSQRDDQGIRCCLSKSHCPIFIAIKYIAKRSKSSNIGSKIRYWQSSKENT